MKTLNQNWALNIRTNKIEPCQGEALSVFPTIVNTNDYSVWCKRCRRWEKIMAFANNRLQSQCGHVYNGPFIADKSVVTYGYNIIQKENLYKFKIKNIFESTNTRKTYENEYELNFLTKRFYRNGKTIINSEDVNVGLCPSVSEIIEGNISEKYQSIYGIKPTVASKLRGFQRLVGYMLCPFNVNFYQICQHWGLNPYDKDFTSLSSGNSPSAENEMFECLGIKPTKTLRKLYQEKPYSVVCYAFLHDLGINDVNLLQKGCTESLYAFIKPLMISFVGGDVFYNHRESLKSFCTDVLEASHNNQKALYNCIERTARYHEDSAIPKYIITDAIDLYLTCREHLLPREKLDIMHEGFNVYTHDFLVHRMHTLNLEGGDGRKTYREENIIFEIESKFLDLEYKCGENFKKIKTASGEDEYMKVEDKDRYCFYVAKNSVELRQIGADMKNCVGSYSSSVQNRRCTIVYAKYREQTKICIEVTPNFSIRQSLGPCNKPLAGDDLEAYHEWCEAKHIQFTKAFKIHVAP